MSRLVFAFFFAATAITFAWVPSYAQADEMDITLHRLGLATNGDGTVQTDNDAWARLMADLAMVVSPPTITPARSLGSRHFYVGFETSYTSIDSSAEHWPLGTEGDDRSTINAGNFDVQSALALSRLTLRKGLPFGIQIGTSIGHLYNTRLFVWSGEVHISLLEGFRHRWPAYFPDFAVRAAVQTVTGENEFDMTIPTLELLASKAIVLGDTIRLSPFIAAQMTWLIADSDVTLVRPREGDDPNGYCAMDIQNCQAVFPEIRATRWRFAAGAELRAGMFTASTGFRFHLKQPSDSDFDALLTNDDRGSLDHLWTVDFALGVTY